MPKTAGDLPTMTGSRVDPCRQLIGPAEIDDVAAAVATAQATVADRVRPGQRVCLAVGSRVSTGSPR